jgi:putative transcriptional regulator
MIAHTMPNHPNRARQDDNPARNPAPVEIRERREAAGLTQAQAAELIYSSARAWQNWEMPTDTIEHRRMPPGLFELFQAKVTHPELFKVAESFPAIYSALLEGKKPK